GNGRAVNINAENAPRTAIVKCLAAEHGSWREQQCIRLRRAVERHFACEKTVGVSPYQTFVVADANIGNNCADCVAEVEVSFWGGAVFSKRLNCFRSCCLWQQQAHQ